MRCAGNAPAFSVWKTDVILLDQQRLVNEKGVQRTLAGFGQKEAVDVDPVVSARTLITRWLSTGEFRRCRWIDRSIVATLGPL